MRTAARFLLAFTCFLPVVSAISHAAPPIGLTSGKRTSTFETLGQRAILPNPNTGYYQFSPTSKMPDFLTPSDIYFRFAWKVVEPEKDVYDFSAIERLLASLEKGQRIALRVMPVNTCCTKDAPIGSDMPDYFREGDLPYQNTTGAHGWYYPYTTSHTRTRLYIPDWNDEFFLSRAEKLIRKLGEKYDGDPRINWVEIGTYGNWGEWHTYPITYPDDRDYAKFRETPKERIIAPADTPTRRFRQGDAATRTRIIQAYAQAFRKTRLIALTNGIHEALKLDMPKPIGFRRDSWGHAMHADLEAYQPKRYTEADLRMIFSRWKVAPFYAESWGYGHSKESSYSMDVIQQLELFHTSALAFAGFFPSGGFATLSQEDQDLFIQAGNRTGYRYAVQKATVDVQKTRLEVSTNWINEGIAPTYDEWVVSAYLFNPDSGKVLGSKVKLPLDLSRLFQDSDFSVDVARLVQKGRAEGIQALFDAYYRGPRKVSAVNAVMDIGKLDLSREDSVELRVIVEDANGYLRPMNLNNRQVNADRSLTLFKLK